ncbi:MAG: MerR family transcriptional regulator [Clostridia bacterium]|nr:MerR family transcriptional regulator [Clostridia bacterium]
MTIGEVSRLSGVTIRTLRHYDRIGLLTPTEVSPAGYRLYDEAALRRLHTILLLRETGLPLESIRRLLAHPAASPARLLALQTQLLTMQRAHIDHLLALTRELQEKGMEHMDFSIFNDHQAADVAAQAESAWGDTPAWQDYASRPRKKGEDERNGQALMALIGQFGRSRPASPDAPEAVAFVRQLQQFITDHFYTCTDEVLAGLADVYQTPAFRRNIDRAGGEGTADFLAEAIRCVTGG